MKTARSRFYVAWDKYGAPHQFKNWKPDADSADSSDNSLPFNKNIDMRGPGDLRIWQITGDEKYKHNAEQLFGFMKSRMQIQRRHHWNYWEPTGQWDLGATEADIKTGEWNPAVAKKTMRHGSKSTPTATTRPTR